MGTQGLEGHVDSSRGLAADPHEHALAGILPVARNVLILSSTRLVLTTHRGQFSIFARRMTETKPKKDSGDF